MDTTFQISGKRTHERLTIHQQTLLKAIADVDTLVVKSSLSNVSGETVPILIGTLVLAYLNLEYSGIRITNRTTVNLDGIHDLFIPFRC
jgi:hypothetical protein